MSAELLELVQGGFRIGAIRPGNMGIQETQQGAKRKDAERPRATTPSVMTACAIAGRRRFRPPWSPCGAWVMTGGGLTLRFPNCLGVLAIALRAHAGGVTTPAEMDTAATQIAGPEHLLDRNATGRMRQTRQQIGDCLRRKGDEAPDHELQRSLRVVDGPAKAMAKRRDCAESQRRRSVVLADDKVEFAMRRQKCVGDAEGRAKRRCCGEIGRKREQSEKRSTRNQLPYSASLRQPSNGWQAGKATADASLRAARLRLYSRSGLILPARLKLGFCVRGLARRRGQIRRRLRGARSQGEQQKQRCGRRSFMKASSQKCDMA